MRSKWKLKYNLDTKDDQLKERNWTILKKDLNKEVLIYNGNKKKSLTITKDMLYFKFGDFFFTRRYGNDIHKKK